MNIDLFQPTIFPQNKIIAGVTKRNLHLFPPNGFSVHKADILTDEEAIVHQQILAEQLGYPVSSLKCNKQVHGSNILFMNHNTVSAEADGMITNERGILIYVKLADCGGILLYDPKTEIVAALHSGWRGTKQNIVKEGIRKLNDEFGVSSADLLVYIAPSAGGKNYEVGFEVAQYFPNHSVEIGNGKYLFDNKSQILEQLTMCGINPQNIEISDVCSIEDTNCHSFRRDNENSGRMAAFIGLR